MRAVSSKACECAFQRFRRDLAVLPGKPDQLEATAEEFRRTALVGSYVGVGVTQHSPPGRREVRECQRVRCCPGRHKERRHFALEQLRQMTLN